MVAGATTILGSSLMTAGLRNSQVPSHKPNLYYFLDVRPTRFASLENPNTGIKRECYDKKRNLIEDILLTENAL